jgi:hypothetical protein
MGLRNRVPKRVPKSADTTRAWNTEPDETPHNHGRPDLQAGHHNPRVGGSSPSSGMTKSPAHTRGFLFVATVAREQPASVAARRSQTP